jgi:glutamine cyclotransferase
MHLLSNSLKLILRYILAVVLLVSFTLYLVPASTAAEQLPVYGYEVVNTYPHDPGAWTQGLAIHDGKLYEGTGQRGQSSLRQVDLETGELLQRHNLSQRYFGEGITILDGRIYQLTWQSHIGFVYDLETFEQQKTFFLAGEGWGITHDSEQIIVSDGTHFLRFLDPETLQETHRVAVMANGTPVNYLNELEYINGEVWANVWYQDILVRIDPATGNVVGVVNMAGLYPRRGGRDEVLNGIAWDAVSERLFVTGKLWSELYEIRVKE